MVYPRLFSQIEALSLFPISRNSYMHLWAPNSSVVQLIILGLEDKLKESTRSLRTCFDLVSSLILLSGMNVYLKQSSTTTVIKKASKWHLSKLFMVEGAELH